MELTLSLGGRDYTVDWRGAVDISAPVVFDSPDDGPFGAPPAHSHPLRAGAFVGSVAQGGSCNCDVHTLCAHTSGTHTECAGHILQQPVHINDVLQRLKTSLLPATLITVQPQLTPRAGAGEGQAEFDRVITRHDVASALATEDPAFLSAVILRTQQHGESATPPYFAAQALRYLVEAGTQHLITDLPSLDREDDANLTGHRIFWEAGPRGSESATAAECTRTVTELARIPRSIADGQYLLDLQVAAFAADAAPSRPVLYPVRAL
jgi:kynurenine formamidase